MSTEENNLAVAAIKTLRETADRLIHEQNDMPKHL